MSEQKPNELLGNSEELNKCPHCQSSNIHHGYGFAAGPLGVYSWCEDCKGPFFNIIPEEELGCRNG